jgi:cardiolipin synthase
MKDSGESRALDRRTVIRHGLETALGIPFTGGNEIKILRNGEEIFPAMLEAVRNARRRIEFLTFVYWTGEIAEEMAHALSERARAGIEVFIMLDSFGAKPMRRELIQQVEQAGCRVRWFRPLATWRVWRSDNRTHRKVLVVDGEIGFTGGVGIAKEWQGAGDRPENWRDNHFRIRGPAVRGLRGGFYEDWMEAADTIAPALEHGTELAPCGGCEMQVTLGQASYGWGDIARLQDALMRLAERRIRIQTPYFAPTEMQVAALLDARRRGVEVEVMIPGPHIDKRVSELAGSDEISCLLKAGTKLWRFQPTMLHSKLVSIDGEAVSVGTANFNTRSVRKDSELMVTVLDGDFAAQMDAVWDADLRHCRQDRLQDWRKRGMVRRLKERLANPLQSQS